MQAWQDGIPAHFDGRRFYNPEATRLRGLGGVLRWKLTSRPEPSPKFIADVEPSVPPRRVEGEALRATLVNHSSVLLQFGGINLLTDPIWSDFAGIRGWLGARRRRAPGVKLYDLPPLDAVLISHNHYDHLDLPTLRQLAARRAGRFLVPRGVGRLLRGENLGPAHELDWGEAVECAGCRIYAVPARHFAARGPFDRNRTLWCGYLIEWRGGNLYFAGDTGFGPQFEWIRQRFGAPRLALLPIGAYAPRWMMAPVHVSPEEAVQAHRILAARTSIAIHHGTFKLTDEGLDTPRKQLEALAPRGFLALKNGEAAEVE